MTYVTIECLDVTPGATIERWVRARQTIAGRFSSDDAVHVVLATAGSGYRVLDATTRGGAMDHAARSVLSAALRDAGVSVVE